MAWLYRLKRDGTLITIGTAEELTKIIGCCISTIRSHADNGTYLGYTIEMLTKDYERMNAGYGFTKCDIESARKRVRVGQKVKIIEYDLDNDGNKVANQKRCKVVEKYSNFFVVRKEYNTARGKCGYNETFQYRDILLGTVVV